MFMVFTTEGLFQEAIEGWPEWDLNPRPLNFVQTLLPTKLSGQEFNNRTQSQLCIAIPFSSFVQLFSVRFHFS